MKNGFQDIMFADEYGVLKQAITSDIQAGIYDMCFENIHIVAHYMYHKLDRKTIEALILELEANLRFGDK